MGTRLLSAVAILVLSLSALTTPIVSARSSGFCQVAAPTTFKGTVTNADRLAAAQRAASARAACNGEGGVTPAVAPLSTPDYFGTTPNYANSPLPTSGASVSVTGGGGSGAAASATVVNGTVVSVAITNPGGGYTSPPTVSLSGGSGAGATAVASLTSGAVTSITVTSGGAGYATGGIRKFVDSLPGLNTANDLGQYLPIAVPDTTTYPGSDYYEIAVVQFRVQMSSDLPATLVRGYVQIETPVNHPSSKHVALANANLSGPSTPVLDSHGAQVYAYDTPQYLGPTIIAEQNVPSRVKFTNYLPTGVAGDLFIPVDTSVMGAGAGPLDATGTTPCDSAVVSDCATYSQNRATLHLHGGVTPWISDGTPNQWTTPAGEATAYPQGVSVVNVPDMPDPGPGSMTFFYTNQQSARLMFYHDHSYGITRLNVYAGEAAGYILQDSTEAAMISNGQIPSDEVPLVIQDKTFVPGASQLAQEDPTWDTSLYGGQGNLWFPHVYMPNQNPVDSMGVNAMGRWDYGPWFWPPYTGLVNGPVANPFAGSTPDEGPTIPGIPNPSIVPEGFMDTPVVNGTIYPYLKVGEKAYRFRILNASNDRTLNLQLYCAASNGQMWDSSGKLVNPGAGEVPMVSAAEGTPGTQGYSPDVLDGRTGGVPNSDAAGPAMVQIGTEGGFLPNPVTLSNSPIGYEYNRRSITVLNVSSHNLMLGPAERADVIVDFSQVNTSKCSNIILYNDAPAPVPAFDSRYDYYTGDPDQTSIGGAPTTIAGYGPNTRTIMQFQVTPTLGVSPAFNAAQLSTTLPAAFAASQDPIIVPEPAYDSVYGQNFSSDYVNIQNTQFTFTPLNAATTSTVTMQPKAIQELFEPTYGRMNATLGVELPNTTGVNQTTIPLGYAEPSTEDIFAGDLATQLGSLDGTQIWKITHNGVDTHFIHFHLFNVQVINRVGWDGAVKPPDPNEMGWKDTVRMNPLEDTIVALRPIAPEVPFGLPDSVRPIDVTRPVGVSEPTISLVDGQPTTFTNALVNFGWEYVWHCHILGHEENDMMRPIKTNHVAPVVPDAPVLTVASSSGAVNLSWTDGTPATTPFGATGSSWGDPKGEMGYRIERAPITGGLGGTVGSYSALQNVLANQTVYSDLTATPGTAYSYRVTAYNLAGDSLTSNASQGEVANSTAPGPPLSVTAAAGTASATVSWSAPTLDGLSPIVSYTVTASGGGGHTCSVTLPGGLSCPVSGLTPGTAYTFTVTATNANGPGGPSVPSNAVVPPAPPDAPTAVIAAAGNGGASVMWFAPLLNGGRAITGYTVTTVGSGQQCTTTGALFCSVTGLTNGAHYTFTVTATNGSGTGAASGPSNSVTPSPTVPGKPTAVTAAAGDGSANVSWTAPTDNGGSAITSYTVTSQPDGQTCSSSTTSCTISGLVNSTAYTFTVTATSTRGTGLPSDPSAPVRPSAPWSVTAGANATTTIAGTQITLTATANQSLGPWPYYLFILTSGGNLVATCSVGTVCTAAVTRSTAGSQTYTAVISTSPGATPRAASGPITLTWTTIPTTYHPMSPTRLVDTRKGTGLLNGTPAKLVANTPVEFHVAGRNDIASSATAVTGNLTVVNSTFLWGVYLGPDPVAFPTASTISFNTGQVAGNGLTVALGAGGTLWATYMSTAGNTTDLVFDVTGYFTPDMSGDTYHPMTSPARVLDTRHATGLNARLKANTPASFPVAGQYGVPLNAQAVTGNVTVVNPSFLWAVYLGPDPVANPGTSTINFVKGETKGNSLTVGLNSTDGSLSATYMSTAGNTTDLVFDVTGYYTADASGSRYVPMTPVRLLDTRFGNGLPGHLVANTPQTFQITGRNTIPASATGITGNVTVVHPSFLWAVYLGPDPVAKPGTSTINFVTGEVKGNGLTVAINLIDGSLSATYMSTPGNTTDLVLDVTGYFVP